jgi:phosphatidylserine/phosphatidylglycerophosphate/cardiolipin synthase-like enzyme
MADPFLQLTDADLRALAAALTGGRLAPPYSPVGVGRVVGPVAAGLVTARLSELAELGMPPEHAAVVLEAIAATRAGRPAPDDAVELVWTGPEVAGTANRDTAVVVRELFAQASDSVTVAGFAVYQGRTVFRGLAERIAACPGLRARLFLDVHRGHQETTPDGEVVRRFARKFVDQDWPVGHPLPEVYYDPRSLDADPAKRSSLHAKCVVVDRRVALVTSANFTEAAQERNIEAGVVVRSARFAARLADHFDALVTAGLLHRLHLPDPRPWALSTGFGFPVA